MEKKVAATVSYTDKDISGAIIEYSNSVLKVWVILICISVFIFGTLYASIKDGFSLYSRGLLSVFIFVFLVAVYYYYLRPVRGYKEFYQLKAESRFEFSLDKVEVTRDLYESSFKWDIFLKIVEAKNYIYFEDLNKALTILPKKYLDEAELQVLREILSTVKGHKYKRL